MIVAVGALGAAQLAKYLQQPGVRDARDEALREADYGAAADSSAADSKDAEGSAAVSDDVEMNVAGGGGGGGGSDYDAVDAGAGAGAASNGQQTMKVIYELGVRNGKLEQELEISKARLQELEEKGASAANNEEHRRITARNRELTVQIA